MMDLKDLWGMFEEGIKHVLAIAITIIVVIAGLYALMQLPESTTYFQMLSMFGPLLCVHIGFVCLLGAYVGGMLLPLKRPTVIAFVMVFFGVAVQFIFMPFPS